MQAHSPPSVPPPLLSPRVLIPFVVVSLIWGSTWIVIRDQLGVVPPVWSVTYRFAIAAAAMFVLLAIRREPMRLPPRGLLFAAIMGIAQFCANFNFVYRAEFFLTSGVVSIIYALLMVPNALLSRLFLGTRLKRRYLVGGAISTIGVTMLLLHEAQGLTTSGHAVLTGALLACAGLLCASTANVMQASEAGRALPPFTLLAWAMLLGALADALFALVTVGAPVIDMRAGYIAGTLYLAIFGSVISFPLYFGLIRTIGPAPAAWTGVVIPVIAMMISTLAEGYSWMPLAIMGAAVAIAGLAYSVWPTRAESPAHDQHQPG